MSDRFFFDGPLSTGDVTLDGPEAHHLSTVRRFQVGDVITLFNGHGHEYPAEIANIGKKRIELRITEVRSPNRELPFQMQMAAALPKGDRGDFLIEKLTELGVTAFTPLITERSIVKVDGTKLEKLRRIVIESSKQCGRNKLMLINKAMTWNEWITCGLTRPTYRLIAHPGESVGSIPRSPKRSAGDAPVFAQNERSNVVISIGPEGGFSEGEVLAALATGWERLSLGPRILRVETAAIAAAVLATQL